MRRFADVEIGQFFRFVDAPKGWRRPAQKTTERCYVLLGGKPVTHCVRNLHVEVRPGRKRAPVDPRHLPPPWLERQSRKADDTPRRRRSR